MPVKKIKVSQLKAATTLVGLWTLGVDATNKSVKVSLEFIKKAYDDVVVATKKALDAATNADTSRTQIEANESTRQTNETARVKAETNRATAETARAKAETNRSTAETDRVKAETARSTAETGRANAEKTRVESEKERVSAETARVKAEEGRVSTEKNRVTEFATIKKNAETATGNANTQADRAKDFSDHQPYMGDNGNWWKWDEAKKEYVDTGILAKGGVLYPSFDINPENMHLYMTYQDDISADMFELKEGHLIFKFK